MVLQLLHYVQNTYRVKMFFNLKGHHFLEGLSQFVYDNQNGPFLRIYQRVIHRTIFIHDSTLGKSWRFPISKSFGSWAGVIFTAPLPKSLST